MRRDVLNQLLAARRTRRAVALVYDLESGHQRLVARTAANEDPLCEAITAGFRFDRGGVHVHDGREYFVSIHNPPLRLIVIGAVHVAQSLTMLATPLGYDVTVIDPRSAFATEQRFPGVRIITGWPDEVLPGLALDHRTAFAALTHDPKIDDPALLIALRGDCFYVGALGSRRNHAGRLERLAAMGAERAVLGRIHGPIGLDIGARDAPEIAVAIVAQMTRTLRLGCDQAQ